jgi:hypothetical protein
MDEASKWWWSLRHQRVEYGPGEPNSERLGPFDSEADAQRALERAKERNDAWEADPNWSD